jgi:glycosyltransferase involved in cell wall biosynthesis
VRVALDAQLAVGTATGIGVYQRDLARALIAGGTEVRELALPALDPWRFDRRVVWDQAVLPLLAARSGADVLHASSGTLPVLRTLPTVVTVHDMAWLRVQAHTRAYARAYFGTLMKRLYRGAAAVLTDSAFSRDEFLTLAGARDDVQVVYPGVDERFATLERRPRSRPLALVVGTIERRKNLLRAIEVLAAVPQLDLVAVGPPTPYLDEVRARAAELGLGERVTLLGYVGRPELDALYAKATLALVPSRYEGFGYALAEAMCAGLPVIAARSSSLVEVAADDAPLVDPDDADGWVEATRAVLADRDAAQARASAVRARAAARFAWPQAAAACAAIYARIARGGKSVDR